MKLYLAGPMRGIPLFNFPAFDAGAANHAAPRQDQRGSIFWPIVIFLIMVAMIVASGGCKSGRSSQNINLTGDLIGQVGVLIETSIPDAGPVGKVNLPVALDKSKQAAASNVKANTEYAALDAKYTKLDGKWYVRWGRRIEAALWLIVGGCIAAQLAGMALMIFTGPVGVGIGAHILAFLPFSNFFLTAAVRIKARMNQPVAGAGGTV